IATTRGLAQAAQLVEQRDQLRFIAGAEALHSLDVALGLRGLRLGGGDEVAVAEEARGPEKAEADCQCRKHRVGRKTPQMPAALGRGIEAGEPGLPKDDLVQQALQKVALAGARRGRRDLALEVEAPRERAEHATDRAALLRAAGEVDTAHERRLAYPGSAKGAIQEFRDERAGHAVLLREAVDRRALLQVARFLQALGQERIEAPLEMAELLLEFLAHAARLLGRVEGRAPDLRALPGIEFRAELGESGEKVGLRDHQVDGDAHAEARIELA